MFQTIWNGGSTLGRPWYHSAQNPVAYVILAYVHPQQRACMRHGILAAVRVSGVTKCICSDGAMASLIIWDRSPYQASRPGNCQSLKMVLQSSSCSRTYARARGGCGEEWDMMWIWCVQCSRVGDDSRVSLASNRASDAIDLCSLRCDAKIVL